MNCVSLVNLNFCLSGAKVGTIIPRSGSRQGDPLSPYLFILVSNVKSSTIIKQQERHDLKGIKRSLQWPEVTQLLCR